MSRPLLIEYLFHNMSEGERVVVLHAFSNAQMRGLMERQIDALNQLLQNLNSDSDTFVTEYSNAKTVREFWQQLQSLVEKETL